MCDDELVRMLSLKEQREAVEERLEWLDQQQAILQHLHNCRMAEIKKQREAALKDMKAILQEQIKGRKQ